MSIPLTEVKGIGLTTARQLEACSICSVEDLISITLEDLSVLPGFGEARAKQVRQAALNLLYKQSQSTNVNLTETAVIPTSGSIAEATATPLAVNVELIHTESPVSALVEPSVEVILANATVLTEQLAPIIPITPIIPIGEPTSPVSSIAPFPIEQLATENPTAQNVTASAEVIEAEVVETEVIETEVIEKVSRGADELELNPARGRSRRRRRGPQPTNNNTAPGVSEVKPTRHHIPVDTRLAKVSSSVSEPDSRIRNISPVTIRELYMPTQANIHTSTMALFCDFENIALGARDARYAAFDIKKVLERLLLKGNIVVRKAYCDWERYKEFKAPMHEAAFELIEIPHLRQSGKNSADIRMVVDALDLCYTKQHLDTFVIISGDSDFTSLVTKLRENNKTVIGVGVKKSTSDLFTSNCDEFIFYDDLLREAENEKQRRAQDKTAIAVKTTPKIGQSQEEAKMQEALDLVLETVEDLFEERGGDEKVWGSMVKQAVKRRNPGFNERYHGFRTFSKLLEEAAARGMLRIQHDEKSGGYIIAGL